MNILGNLYVSNGIEVGNTESGARVKALYVVFERHVTNRLIAETISLPAILQPVLARYPGRVEPIATLEGEGFPIFLYDASLGVQFPVIYAVLFNSANGTYFSFWAPIRISA